MIIRSNITQAIALLSMLSMTLSPATSGAQSSAVNETVQAAEQRLNQAAEQAKQGFQKAREGSTPENINRLISEGRGWVSNRVPPPQASSSEDIYKLTAVLIADGAALKYVNRRYAEVARRVTWFGGFKKAPGAAPSQAVSTSASMRAFNFAAYGFARVVLVGTAIVAFADIAHTTFAIVQDGSRVSAFAVWRATGSYVVAGAQRMMGREVSSSAELSNEAALAIAKQAASAASGGRPLDPNVVPTIVYSATGPVDSEPASIDPELAPYSE